MKNQGLYFTMILSLVTGVANAQSPQPITEEKAKALASLHEKMFDPSNSTGTMVSFSIEGMEKMLQAYKDGGASTLRIYFGAENLGVRNNRVKVIGRTVFFKAARTNNKGIRELLSLPAYNHGEMCDPITNPCPTPTPSPTPSFK